MLADTKASKRKSQQHGVRVHRKRRGCNILSLHNSLMDNAFVTSPYHTFILYDPKEREIKALPYFPDRIVHHAIMNALEPVFTGCFTADTYSCIKGKGIHGLKRGIERALRNAPATKYCFKLDVTKFYPSIGHAILKQQLRRKIKDKDLLALLDEIIDSSPGVPIGNYLSQYFANFYLTGFDHWLKETMRVKHYFRYADDMAILAPTKEELHKLRVAITQYLADNLKLTVKGNYQVFEVDERGLDMGGYRFYSTHTLLRKSIKKSLCRVIARRRKRNATVNRSSVSAYYGWAKHCDSRHLLRKLNLNLS